jgi:hypothetical protein
LALWFKCIIYRGICCNAKARLHGRPAIDFRSKLHITAHHPGDIRSKGADQKRSMGRYKIF